MSEEIISENPFDPEREHNPFDVEPDKPFIIIRKDNNITANCLSFAAGSLIGVAGIITAAVLSRKSEKIYVNTETVKKDETVKK